MNLRPEDIPDVKEESFRYPGPKAKSKEAAILSLADSVESASRSLERPTPQRIADMIQGIIDSRIEDHQLDECPLTLDELNRVAQSLKSTLVNMMHSRVAYPKKEEKTVSTDKRDSKSAAA